ncbi:hypothetical protein ACFQGX_28510 [Nonomuraea dietziae]
MRGHALGARRDTRAQRSRDREAADDVSFAVDEGEIFGDLSARAVPDG